MTSLQNGKLTFDYDNEQKEFSTYFYIGEKNNVNIFRSIGINTP